MCGGYPQGVRWNAAVWGAHDVVAQAQGEHARGGAMVKQRHRAPAGALPPLLPPLPPPLLLLFLALCSGVVEAAEGKPLKQRSAL